MKKCGLLLLSFAVLSTSLSVLFSDVSNAASDYDSVYQKTDNLIIQAPSCPQTDVKLDYTTKFQQSQRYSPTAYDSYMTAVNGDGRWGVSQTEDSYLGKGIVIFWTPDDSLNLVWTTSGVFAGGNSLRFVNLYNIDSSSNINCSTFDILNYEQTNYVSISNPSINTKNLFVYADNYNYPQNYEGSEIPSGISSKNIVLPDIDYSVTGKTIKFKYNSSTTPFTTCSVNWMITKTNYEPDDFENDTFAGTLEDAWDEWQNLTDAQQASDDNNKVLDFRYQKLSSQEQTYTVPDYGNYYVLLGLNTHWPGAPYASCGDNGDPDGFDYDTKPKLVALKIDGTPISGSTVDQECGAGGGFCDGHSGTTGNPILSIFHSLDNVETFGLQSFLLAPINFYATIPTLTDNCSPISFPLFGQNVSLACMSDRYWHWSSLVMTVYTTTINALVAYVVATRIFETIKNVKSPDKDGIEVVKL